MGNTVFFESRSWCKDDIYWLLRSSYFELFGDEKYGLSFSQKVDGKMIFTWSFWVFHDNPGLGKYGFSCSVTRSIFSMDLFAGAFYLTLWAYSELLMDRGPPSLKSVAQLLEWQKLAKLYLTRKRSKKHINHVTHPLGSADVSVFSLEISNFCYFRKYLLRLLHFNT